MKKIVVLSILIALFLILSIPKVESKEPYIFSYFPSDSMTPIESKNLKHPYPTIEVTPAPTPVPTPKPTPAPKIVTGEWIYDPEVSWYGPGLYGNGTACGQTYTTTIMGVAHRSLPCGTLVEFKWNGITKTVPVIDRGPFVEGRTWDLSGALCTALNHCFTGPIQYRLVK